LLPFASVYFLFISFYFHESGLFNGLRAREIKKFAPPPSSRAGCDLLNISNSRSLLARPPAGRVYSDDMNIDNSSF